VTLAWVGGAAFVASLLYFLYFYLVLLGRPVGGANWLLPVVINAALFTVFALHHSIMPRRGAKEWLARMLPGEAERTLYVWVSSVLLVVLCLLWRPVPGVVYEVRGAWAWLLYTVQLAGIGLTIRASGKLDVLELAGIRQVHGARKARPPTPLQMRGPYTLVRHPVYLGWIMLVFGAPNMTANRLSFAVISTLYLAIAVLFEERSLEQAFGASYREYKRRVRWRFLPGVY
jgi:protein-S-isoprenylcysteine O-methyltransferase Ste14